MSRRRNPIVKSLPRNVAGVVRRNHEDLSRLGAKFSGWKACGAFGCVARDEKRTGIVWKITKDPSEIRLIDVVTDVRSGSMRPARAIARPSSSMRRLGVSARHWRRASGLVWLSPRIYHLGGPWYVYSKERVTPLDGTAAWLRAESGEANHYYETSIQLIESLARRHAPSVERILERSPEWGEVARTVWALREVYGLSIADTHDSNVGIPLKRRWGRPSGQYVAIDAQLA